MRIHLQAHDAVHPRAVVDRAEGVRGSPDVLHGNLLVEVVSTQRGIGRERRLDLVVVLVAPADGFLKNGGIGRKSPQPIFIDEALELSAGHEAPADVVEPERLSFVVEGTGRRCDGIRFGHGRSRVSVPVREIGAEMKETAERGAGERGRL
jgi:hypothetical protein